MTGDPDGDGPLPPNLRFLKTLVTVLTATMILGLITMIALFVIRLGPGAGDSTATLPPLPDEIVLPDGAKALSVTWGKQHYVVVTEDNRVLIFDLDGTLTQTVDIK